MLSFFKFTQTLNLYFQYVLMIVFYVALIRIAFVVSEGTLRERLKSNREKRGINQPARRQACGLSVFH